jgi:tRNA threonylcarbamoyladenosine biosynthesis protein TsaE
MIVESRSAEETLELGRRVGAVCGAGALVALEGELGAGKTRFVKGLALGAGVPDADVVTSPTFVLLNLYGGRVPVAHYDLYRLDAVDLPALGFHDFRETSLMVVEWAEKVEERLFGDHVRVRIEIAGENSRRLMFGARGPRSVALLSGLNLYP